MPTLLKMQAINYTFKKNKMKQIFKLFIAATFFATIFNACKKQENQIVFEGGTAPVLTATNASTASINLTKTNENNVFSTFSWTNPNYKFSNGVSSQDVSYTLQFDTTGANFTNPNLQEITIAKDLSTPVTVKAINTALAKLLLQENVPHNLEVRVKSTLANASVPLYSNIVKFILVPYLDVAVVLPADLPTPGANNGDLFLVGDATAGGWNNPVPVPSQKFTRTSTTTYEIITALVGGKEYLLLPKNGDWSNKYAVTDKNAPGLNTGGDFGANKNDNLPSPATSGNYKIVVNFKTGKFTVTRL
jgi:starch-binding outer membrane protein SusE/F